MKTKRKKPRRRTNAAERTCPKCGDTKPSLLHKAEYTYPPRIVFRYKCGNPSCNQVFVRVLLQE